MGAQELKRPLLNFLNRMGLLWMEEDNDCLHKDFHLDEVEARVSPRNWFTWTCWIPDFIFRFTVKAVDTNVSTNLP